MPKHIAFLRAINVGGHTVKMDHLRNIFESLGFSNVETFIASELDPTEYYPKNETVMILDLVTMTLETLATTDHGYVFLPHEWVNDQLVIKDRTNNSLLIFNPKTKQFIPFAP